jgi:hypothetical protein
MVDDGNVYRFGDDRFWVMINTAALRTGSGRPRAVWMRRSSIAPTTADGRAGPDVAGHAATARRSRPRELYFRFWLEPVTVAGVPPR